MQTPQSEDSHDQGAVAVAEPEAGDGSAPSSDGIEGEKEKGGEERNLVKGEQNQVAPAMPSAKKKRSLPGTPGIVLHTFLAKSKPFIRKEH